MEIMKKTISLFLALVMVVGMLPMNVLATEDMTQETVPAESISVTGETVPVETTAPEATVPETAAPAVTVPEATEPEEPIPETTEVFDEELPSETTPEAADPADPETNVIDDISEEYQGNICSDGVRITYDIGCWIGLPTYMCIASFCSNRKIDSVTFDYFFNIIASSIVVTPFVISDCTTIRIQCNIINRKTGSTIVFECFRGPLGSNSLIASRTFCYAGRIPTCKLVAKSFAWW